VPRKINIGGNQIGALVLNLEDGQEWDDPVTVTMRRDQWHATLVAGSSMLRQTKQGIDDCLQAANEGDPMAILVGPHLVETAKLTQDALRDIARAVLPAMMDEVDALDAASEAIDDFVKSQAKR
jgi:hypothetical protein